MSVSSEVIISSEVIGGEVIGGEVIGGEVIGKEVISREVNISREFRIYPRLPNIKAGSAPLLYYIIL